jgi:hypothetical protein
VEAAEPLIARGQRAKSAASNIAIGLLVNVIYEGLKSAIHNNNTNPLAGIGIRMVIGINFNEIASNPSSDGDPPPSTGDDDGGGDRDPARDGDLTYQDD